jgi:hypothetical protein
MDHDENDILIARYLKGELNKAEQAEFENRLLTEPELAEAVKDTKAIFVVTDFIEIEELGTVWKAQRKQDRLKLKRRRLWLGGLLVAAALIALLLILLIPSGPGFAQQELDSFCDISLRSASDPQAPPGSLLSPFDSSLCQQQRLGPALFVQQLEREISRQPTLKKRYFYWLGVGYAALAESQTDDLQAKAYQEKAIATFREIKTTCQGQAVCREFEFSKRALEFLEKLSATNS